MHDARITTRSTCYGDDPLTDDFNEIMGSYFARLREIKQKTAQIAADHAAYQVVLRELNNLENEGIKIFSENLQTAREQGSYALAAQIEETIHRWEKETADLLKLLHRKSPRGY